MKITDPALRDILKEVFDVHITEADKALITTLVKSVLEQVPPNTLDPKIVGEILQRVQNGMTNMYKLGAFRILKDQHKQPDFYTS